MNQSVKIPLGVLLILAVQQAPLGAELTDPTRPVVVSPPAITSGATAGKQASPLKLEAILISNERRVAIVNGKLLRVGERLGEVRIDAITATAIHYSRAGRSQTLQLAQPAIKVRRHAAALEAKR